MTVDGANSICNWLAYRVSVNLVSELHKASVILQSRDRWAMTEKGKTGMQNKTHCISRRATISARCSSCSTPPALDTFAGDGGRAELIEINDIGEEGSPAVVWHAAGVVEGRLADGESLHSFVVKRSDVVRLAIVVPGNDLDEIRLIVDNLYPSVIPYMVAAP